MHISPPKWISKLIPPDTKRTVAPPGKLRPSANPLPLVVVAAFPRSGTHVLIDLILNNFPAYRRVPLYVNLDEYLLQGLDVDDLIQKGGYVVKTHYPEKHFCSDNHEAYEKVFANAAIFVPIRSERDIFCSFQKMVDSKRKEHLVEDHAAFWEFWSKKAVHTFLFACLITPEKAVPILDEIQSHLGLQRAKRAIGPPDKRHRLKVYLRKLATRIFGNRLRIVNTTVGFNRGMAHPLAVRMKALQGARKPDFRPDEA